jgi:hypothetical protein
VSDAAAALTEAFARLATTGPWTGADSTASAELPDGRTAWLFSDTMLGSVRLDHSRDRATPMVHNSLVMQDGSDLQVLLGGTVDKPASLIDPPGDDFAWIGSAVATGGGLYVVANTYRATGAEQFDIKLTGTVLAAVSLGETPDVQVRDLDLGAAIAWGSAMADDGEHTYIYGSEFAAGRRYAHVARVPLGYLDSPWELWDGHAWSRWPERSARILAHVGTAFGVQRTGDGWLLVTFDCREPFLPDIVSYSAESPTGPWLDQRHLLTVPEMATPGIIAYDARVHPHLADLGRLLVSYNVHSLDPEVLYADARVYRPRFVAPPLPETGGTP